MITIDNRSRLPVYEQIKNQIMLFIQLGVLKPNEQLKSIRTLSQELNINVNTVKRSFLELETSGVIYTVPGKGCFVSENAFSNEKIKKDALDEVRSSIQAAIAKGVTKNDMLNLINEIYGRDSK